MAGKAWSEAEDADLARLWDSDLTLEEVAAHLPGRTLPAIRVRVKRLGLRHTDEQFRHILSKKTSGERNGMSGRVGPRRGVVLTPEVRAKLSRAAKAGYADGVRVKKRGADNPAFGKPSVNRGVPLPVEVRQVLARKACARWQDKAPEERASHMAKMRGGWLAWSARREPTGIERQVSQWLQEAGVGFQAQAPFGHYIVDFHVGRKIIETHGDYWHGNPRTYATLDPTQRSNQRRDRAKATYIQRQGCELLVLWEADLKTQPEVCRQELLAFLARGGR